MKHDGLIIGINALSLAHVARNDGRLYAVLIFSYLFTFLFIYLIRIEYREFARLRQDMFLKAEVEKPRQQLYSIQVENIPKTVRTPEELKALFEDLFPGDVHSAVIAATLTPLGPVLKKRNAVINRIERLNAFIESHKSSQHEEEEGRPSSGNYSSKSSALLSSSSTYRKKLHERDMLQRQLDLFNAEVGLIEDQARSVEHRSSVSSTGFITFLSLRSFRAAQQPLLFHDYPRLFVTAAPTPTDIIWENISIPALAVETISALVKVYYYAGVFLWVSLVTSLTGLASADSLRIFFPFIVTLDYVGLSFFSGLLPSLVLIILMNNLPEVFQWVAWNVTRIKSRSAIQLHCLEWCAMCLLFPIVISNYINHHFSLTLGYFSINWSTCILAPYQALPLKRWLMHVRIQQLFLNN